MCSEIPPPKPRGAEVAPRRGRWQGKRCSVRQCAAARGELPGEGNTAVRCRERGAAGSRPAVVRSSPGGPAVPLPSRDGRWVCVATQKAVLAMLAGAKILGRLSRVSSSRRCADLPSSPASTRRGQ